MSFFPHSLLILSIFPSKLEQVLPSLPLLLSPWSPYPSLPPAVWRSPVFATLALLFLFVGYFLEHPDSIVIKIYLFFVFHSFPYPMCFMGFPGGSDGKESACNAGDLGLIPGSGRSPGEGTATQSSSLAWEIPRTEEPSGLQSVGSQRVGHNWATNTHWTVVGLSCST